MIRRQLNVLAFFQKLPAPRNLRVSRSSQIGYVDAQRGLQTLISAM
jgi:hypothetical protein